MVAVTQPFLPPYRGPAVVLAIVLVLGVAFFVLFFAVWAVVPLLLDPLQLFVEVEPGLGHQPNLPVT